MRFLLIVIRSRVIHRSAPEDWRWTKENSGQDA
jgi:hypothetical protein